MSKLTPYEILKKLQDNGHTYAEIGEIAGISVSTAHHIINQENFKFRHETALKIQAIPADVLRKKKVKA